MQDYHQCLLMMAPINLSSLTYVEHRHKRTRDKIALFEVFTPHYNEEYLLKFNTPE
jgi:hypothetical protein